MACCNPIGACHALRQIASTVASVELVRIVPVVLELMRQPAQNCGLANSTTPIEATPVTSFRVSPENRPSHPGLAVCSFNFDTAPTSGRVSKIENKVKCETRLFNSFLFY